MRADPPYTFANPNSSLLRPTFSQPLFRLKNCALLGSHRIAPKVITGICFVHTTEHVRRNCNCLTSYKASRMAGQVGSKAQAQACRSAGNEGWQQGVVHSSGGGCTRLQALVTDALSALLLLVVVVVLLLLFFSSLQRRWWPPPPQRARRCARHCAFLHSTQL